MKIFSRTGTVGALILIACAFAAAAGPRQAKQSTLTWAPLFNGRDLAGWEAPTAGSWVVENGEIVTHRAGPQDRAGGWLVTKKNYSDFILRMKFKSNAKIFNSGILIRDPGHARIGRPAFNGFEIQLAKDATDAENPTGSIYDVARSYEPEMDPQQWYSFEVQCIGDHIVALMNGKKTAEAYSRRSYYGAVGMQIHGGNDPVDYHFKDLEIAELPPAPRPSQLMEERLQGSFESFEPLPMETSPGWTTENDVFHNVAGNARDAVAKAAFSEFVLDFSFRLSKGGRASVGLRGKGGYEYRLAENDEENPTGSVVDIARGFELNYCLQRVYRPGQWNTVQIYVSGDHVVTYLNLVRVAEGSGPHLSPKPIVFHADPGSTVEFCGMKIKRVARK